MKRGTTPTITLKLDADLSGYTLYFTMKGGGATITKTNDDMVVKYIHDADETIAYVPLSQDDTLRFRANSTVRCQMRMVRDGFSIASDIYEVEVEEVLQDGKVVDLVRGDGHEADGRCRC